MKMRIELTKAELVRLVIAHMQETLNVTLSETNIRIETKSTQNYKSEWENADFRAVYEQS